MTPRELPRRQPAEDDFPQGVMQWAQLALKVTTTTAVIVIAGFLVWRLSGGFEVFAHKMDALTVQHSEMALQYKQSDNMTRRMLVVLRIMCINSSKTEQQRQSCLQESIP